MKSLSKFSFLALLIIVGFSSCGKVEDGDNDITDPEGINIELTWSNNAANPAQGTDLELYVRQNFSSLVSSTNYNAFEDLDITPGLLNDGDYSLEVYVDNIDRVTNYKITVTGKSTKKSYSQDFGPLNANDNNGTLKPLSLKVSGNRYSVY